jgi:hypothetical protein
MVRQSAVAGALYGGILVPVRPDENNFWQSRLRNSAVQSATFATLSGASIGISEMGQAFKSAPRLASFLSNDIAAGTLSAVPAGLVNANSESILNGHGFASGADTGKSIYSFAVIGGTLAIGNKAMAKIAESRVEIPVGGNETPQESAQILGLKLPKMTDGQQALAEATIVEPKRDGRGSMQHEKYKATAQLSDGSEHDVIVRAFPRGWWATSRFRYEQAAYHLNKMIGLDNGFPTTALRTFEKDGNLTRAWVQDASGRTFGEAIEDLARQRYGSSSDDAVSKLVKEDHPLRLQIQQAFVERFLYGDTDPSAFNMVMHQQPNLRVQNIDLDMAFHGDPTPGVTSSPAYGVNHRLFSDFANQPLPASLHSKLSQFVRNYDNLPGRTKIMELGLTGGETSGLMARARWFVRNGIFPESHSLSL